MNPAIHGAIVSAEKRRREREEEERMTTYSNDDLNENWEFKIVRSGSNAFRRPEVFQRLVEEEAVAGWQLVEKLDDSRVRFKRPQSARRNDAMLPPDIDPYRTQYGSQGVQTILAFVLLALLSGVIGVGLTVALGK